MLLTDPAFSGGAFLLGHPRGVRPPIVVCGVIPLMIASRDTAPYGMGLTPLPWSPRPAPQRAAERRGRAHRVPAGGASGRPGQPRAARRSAAVPGPRLAPARRGDRAVHGPGVRVPPLRRPGHPALRRSALGHRLRGAVAALVGRARRLAPGRPRHPGDDREPRLPADHRADPRGPRRRTTCWSSSPPVAGPSTRSRLSRRTPAPRRTCRTTSCCRGPMSSSPTAATAASSTRCATASPLVTSSGKEDKPEVAGRIAWSGVGRRLKTETPSPEAVGCRRTRRPPRPGLPGPGRAHRREHGARRRDGRARAASSTPSRPTARPSASGQG